MKVGDTVRARRDIGYLRRYLDKKGTIHKRVEAHHGVAIYYISIDGKEIPCGWFEEWLDKEE